MFKDFAAVQNQNLSHDKQLFSHILNLSGQVFRQVKSRITMRVELEGGTYFIKKYFPLTLNEILKNLLSLKWPFESAINECKAINAVKFLEIKTLDLAAYGSQRAIIQNKSFLITRAIEPNINFDDFALQLVSSKNYFKFKRWVIAYIASTTRKLHVNGLNHRDYYLCHYLLNIGQLQVDFIVKNFDSMDLNAFKKQIEEKLYLIDLHRMQIRNKVPDRYIIKDLSAMLFSVRNLKLTRTDYLRFLSVYMNFSSAANRKKFMAQEKKFLDKIFSRARATTEKG